MNQEWSKSKEQTGGYFTSDVQSTVNVNEGKMKLNKSHVNSRFTPFMFRKL